MYYPSLDINTLQASYDMLGRWEDETLSPLAGLVLVQQRLTAPHALRNIIAYNEIVYEILSSLLLDQFSLLRTQNNLPALQTDRTHGMRLDEAINDLQQCGTKANRYLIGYAALYYRYMRPELELSVEEISQHLNQTDRNLRRHEKKCLGVLLSELNRLELEARAAQRRLRCLLALPQDKLLNLDSQLVRVREISDRIANKNAVSHWYIYGPAGVGKSSLALQISRQLVDRNIIGDVIWLDLRLTHPSNQPLPREALADLVSENLRLQGSHEGTSSSQLIYNYLAYLANDHQQLLLILDNADGWQSIIEANWAWLQQTVLIVTARVPYENWQQGEVKCQELSKQESLYYLQNLERIYPFRREPLFEEIVQRVGGNPAALKRIFRFMEMLSPQETLDEAAFVDHHRFQWEHLPEFSQEVYWWLAGFTIQQYVNRERLLLAKRYFFAPQSITLNQNLEYLAASGLVECNIIQERQTYRVPEDSWQITAHIDSAAQKLHEIIRHFLRIPNENSEECAEIASSFLTLLQSLDFDWVDVTVPLAKICQSLFIHTRQWRRYLGLLDWINKKALPLTEEKMWIGIERASILRRLGNFEEAKTQLASVFYTAQQFEDMLMLSDTLMEQSILLFYQDNDQAAFEKAQQAYEILRTSSDNTRLERSIYLVAQALSRTNALNAREWVQGITRRDAEVWDLVARIELNLDNQAALLAAEKAIALLDPDNPAYPRSLGLLARALVANGKISDAIEKFHLAINLLQRQHDPVGLARMHNNLGVAYLESDQTEYLKLAQNEFERSLQIAQTIQDKHNENIAIQNLAHLRSRPTDRRRHQ
ncbi:MAG: hypothetical protein BroJett018_12550 [Chloroflexota bacterium]|nr:MAG: hypothetical protein BroJett018_12550 [Chloroflexota bacterium]